MGDSFNRDSNNLNSIYYEKTIYVALRGGICDAIQ